jgi:hypothetical protein
MPLKSMKILETMKIFEFFLKYMEENDRSRSRNRSCTNMDRLRHTAENVVCTSFVRGFHEPLLKPEDIEDRNDNFSIIFMMKDDITSPKNYFKLG